MILDPYGRALKRAIGFMGGYVFTGEAKPPTSNSLDVVGIEAPKGEEDEDGGAALLDAGRVRRAG
jgi:hypothetical protein